VGRRGPVGLRPHRRSPPPFRARRGGALPSLPKRERQGGGAGVGRALAQRHRRPRPTGGPARRARPPGILVAGRRGPGRGPRGDRAALGRWDPQRARGAPRLGAHGPGPGPLRRLAAGPLRRAAGASRHRGGGGAHPGAVARRALHARMGLAGRLGGPPDAPLRGDGPRCRRWCRRGGGVGERHLQRRRPCRATGAPRRHLAGGSGPWPEPLPYGRRLRTFAGLREWMAEADRERRGGTK
jgi:hypothetical protein